jgi:hypothetical protein
MPSSSSPETNLLTQQLLFPFGSALRNRLGWAAMSEVLGTHDNSQR